MATLMGSGPSGSLISNTNSQGILAGLAGGNANGSAGGSALQLGMGEMVSPNFSTGAQAPIPGMPFTEHNVPSRPGYHMVPMDAIHSKLPSNATEKHILSRNAEVLREELIGYANAIIERMDRANALKKFETF